MPCDRIASKGAVLWEGERAGRRSETRKKSMMNHLVVWLGTKPSHSGNKQGPLWRDMASSEQPLEAFRSEWKQELQTLTSKDTSTSTATLSFVEPEPSRTASGSLDVIPSPPASPPPSKRRREDQPASPVPAAAGAGGALCTTSCTAFGQPCGVLCSSVFHFDTEI